MSAELMGSGDPAELAQQLSAELERLPGVLAAAVWLDDAGMVERVRVHTQPMASASIVAHASARVLERRGQILDPGKLRIVPVAAIGEAVAPLTPGRFLVLHDVSWTREGSRINCRVRLAREAEILTGEATELDTESGRARAAAAATLRAAEATMQELALGLEGTAVLPLFGRRYMVVSVEAALQRRFAQLSGIVVVDPARSLEEAAALATLRAIDRWIAV